MANIDFLGSPYGNMFGRKFKRKPKCKTCNNEKLGLETVCKMYKKIPMDVQKGGYCGYYDMTKTELERIEKREMEEYEKKGR